ncbi:hypothetical protein B0H13DRAFT_1898228 [Mycena leptocephala]|nr:hypothetical protein B0H13DRAFT_1898228 [Mycena leptocephala]
MRVLPGNLYTRWKYRNSEHISQDAFQRGRWKGAVRYITFLGAAYKTRSAISLPLIPVLLYRSLLSSPFFIVIISFASIAIFLVSLSGLAVQSAHVKPPQPAHNPTPGRPRPTGPQACSDVGGAGNCFFLLSGAAFEAGLCNNVGDNVKSLVFDNPNDECVGFTHQELELQLEGADLSPVEQVGIVIVMSYIYYVLNEFESDDLSPSHNSAYFEMVH